MPSSLSSSQEMKKRDVSSLLPIRSGRGAGETKPPLSHTPEHGIQETSSSLAAAAAARGGEGRRRVQPRRPSPKKFGAAINSLSFGPQSLTLVNELDCSAEREREKRSCRGQPRRSTDNPTAGHLSLPPPLFFPRWCHAVWRDPPTQQR